MTDDRSEPNELSALVGPFWSTEKVCQSLRVTADVLASRQEAGEILGLVTGDGMIVFPVWQFQRSDPASVRPELTPVFRILRRHDGWTVAVLLHTPSPELDGMAPLEWLRRGNDPETVIDLARVVAREWNAGRTP